MARTDLSVPYLEKEEAKVLGAKWDAAQKLWYVPDGIEPSRFKKWFPKAESMKPNVRCNRFFVASAIQDCGQCRAPVKMVTFVLPKGWEEWHAEACETKAHWGMEECDVILNGVNWVSETALTAACKITPLYKLVHKVYLSHCEK